MGEYWRIFKLLILKNMIVRKKHWRMTLFIEITLPLLLFLLGQVVRMLTGSEPMEIEANTYHPVEYLDVYVVPLSDFEMRYTPKNELTKSIMEMTTTCAGFSRKQVNGSLSEDTMIGELTKIQSDFPQTEFMGIVFETLTNSTLPKNFNYKVLTSRRLPQELYEEEENGYRGSIAFPGYFVRTQMCLDQAYIRIAGNLGELKPANISVQQMPYPPYIYIDKLTRDAGLAFSELAIYSFLIVLCVEVTYPTNEKYIGVNILMSINGVKNHQNLFSWLISGAIFSTLYLGPIVIMLKYFLPPTILPYLQYGNSFIIWLVLTIHVCHVIAFGMHITAYLWKPSHAVFATFMVTMIMNIINQYATGAGIKHFLIYLGIFSPNFLLARIFNEINTYESKLVGVQWSNIFAAGDAMAPGESCIGVLVIFSLIGIIIHFFLAVYVYAIRPGKFGVAENPFFFLQKRRKIFHDSDLTKIDYDRDDQKEFEKVPDGTLEAGIQIRELKKSYTTNWFRGTKVQALRGINVDFYKGQITALLGHNGAGKTTMMSILSGLTNSTEGIVFINGQNVQYELDSVRRNLGLCPQENMVFPDLSVHEQVLFFGMLKAKNKTRAELNEDVEVLLNKVNLSDKKNSIARELSGGQKRRMCLAMAVIGDASILILDEPTSGMDAESKREVWDIILKLRGEKTTLISTHDMEEADILGDRIAIIHSGKMRSYGTSMFLKKLYGDGQVEVTLSIEPSCDPRKIIEEIGLDAQILSRNEGHAVLAIPFADNLPQALDTLETQKKKLGVTGLSVSIITLEQVFLRVTRNEGDVTDSSDQAAKAFIKLTGFNYFLQTTLAYFVKKLAFTRKNPWTFLISMILPCLSGILMVLYHSGTTSKPKLISLTLSSYTGAQAFSYSSNSLYGDMYEKSARDNGATSTWIGTNYSITDALLKVANEDLSAYRNRFIVSGEFNETTNGPVHANGLYSGTAFLGVPATLNMLANTIVKVVTKNDDYTIGLTAQQLPDTNPSMHQTTSDSFTLTMALLVFLAPAVAMYVTQPLQENLSGVKQLQTMTGASSFSYWGSIYIFDLIQYTTSVVLLISTFIITDICFGTRYYFLTEILIFFLILFLFGASILPLVYLVSFMKKSMNASTNLLSITPIILSFVDFLLYPLSMSLESKIFDVFRAIQSKIFLLIPHISLIYGHVSFFTIVGENARCRRLTNKILDIKCSTRQPEPCCLRECHDGWCKNPLSYFDDSNSILGPDFLTLSGSLVWMTCSTILFFVMIFILEEKLLFRLYARFQRDEATSPNATMDELVRKEAYVVSTEISKLMIKNAKQPVADSENIFLAHMLRKNYGNLEVVRGTSFRVKHGECFGLLGVNGAGKSTTFRMLTGEEIPRGGSMYLKHYSLATNRSEYLGRMGYCPQQDAIIDTLNSWDHLYLFARLRGIPRNEVKAAVEKWIHKLNLNACASQPSGTYSGGNKRRLNIAMALIGNPSLVLMDEPTTGVDPAARRSLWNTLKTCQEGGQSIILTSHSMEECEALCNRLVIMVKGQLVCVGASQELKQRFGAGYNIHVKLNPGRDSDDVEKIKRQIETTLVCKLSDENTGFIGYHVTDPNATWTAMYSLMNELKNDYSCIENFAVLSSTLEQLFIQFARAPGDDDETDRANKVKKRRWWRKKEQPSPV